MADPSPPPSSIKGLLWLALILVAIGLILAFLLGDAWMRWFPRE